MAAFNIQEALIWKEKVESVIDQYQESLVANGIKYVSFEYKSGIDNGRKSSSSDHDSQFLFMVYSVPLKKVAYDQGGGFNISPLKPQNGRPRTQVQHLMQIDLKGWGVGYISSFQQHCLLQMLNNVADERSAHPRIPVMVNMASTPMSSKKSQKLHNRSTSLEQINAANKNGMTMDEYTDEDDEFQIPDPEKKNALIKLICPVSRVTYNVMTGIMVVTVGEYLMGTTLEFVAIIFIMINQRSGKHLMELVAVDWFKDTKRMDHVARRRGCAAQVASEKGFFSIVVNLQVPGSTHYNMIFYFVMKELVPGSLLQRFVDGDDEFRYSRLKIIPSVPHIDVDIGSSTVANGVLGLVIGMITTLVVVLLQANTANELPEQLIGAVRVSHRVVVCYCP
ncbi:hypothetical protein TEA_026737 [Camellia sinensis var. sinensis]|uniref:Protein ENHANCED DISEASE RESISTANCE 2 C-terminal domain-containing protein n=1 Tax=Camellia sinensis var. sinensis TaxID=542762 RepID=A0A4S4CWY0_CAMSN|nr:hypothetical protein TEA_026737 [Camellia sinensis var. sinensis]